MVAMKTEQEHGSGVENDSGVNLGDAATEVMTKEMINYHLFDDTSYRGAAKARQMLQDLGSNAEERKSAMHSLYSAEEIETGLTLLEARLSRFTGYRRHLEGVHERLDQFADRCGGSDTWAFAVGADPGDRIEALNVQHHMGERNEGLNAALMRVRALYGAYEHGRPFITEPVDGYLQKVNKIAGC